MKKSYNKFYYMLIQIFNLLLFSVLLMSIRIGHVQPLSLLILLHNSLLRTIFYLLFVLSLKILPSLILIPVKSYRLSLFSVLSQLRLVRIVLNIVNILLLKTYQILKSSQLENHHLQIVVQLSYQVISSVYYTNHRS